MNIDWESVIGIVAFLFVTALLVERAMAALFSWKYWEQHAEGRGLRLPVAFAVSLAAVVTYKFDAFAALLSAPAATIGYLLTAGTICGGAQPIMALFARIAAGKDAARGMIANGASNGGSK